MEHVALGYEMVGGADLYKMSTLGVTYPNSVVLHSNLPIILDTFSTVLTILHLWNRKF